MILKRLTPMNFGPFASSTELHVEDDLTVLTGANDSGKSMLLRIIALLNNPDSSGNAVESDRNFSAGRETEHPWGSDPEVGCSASFKKNLMSTRYIEKRDLTGIEEFALRCCFSPKVRETRLQWVRHGGKSDRIPAKNPINKMPIAISFPLTDQIGQTIDLLSPNSAQTKFLQAIFGQKFVGGNFAAKSIESKEFDLADAQERLDELIRRITPARMELRFSLRTLSEDKPKLTLFVKDENRAYTPLSSRGAGVVKLVNILGTLISTEWENDHVFLLLDEPETSLHADAQHALRGFLEELAERDNVQVIYATHSPSMINNTRARSLRLLTREKKDGKPTTVIDNNPIAENFFPVRASLGLTPADSLLYAAVTVVLDGKTEVLCLTDLLRKLHEAKVDGFADLDQILSEAHFLDGRGASFKYHCGLAKSQGAQVVLFLDGDEQHKSSVAEVRQKHPDVPIVFLDKNEEIEDLVEREEYFRALADVSGESSKKLNLAQFEKWAANKKFKPRVMFTKRIQKWLDAEFPEVRFKKVEVMKKAVEFAEATSIKSDKLKQLLVEMRVKLQSNS